MILLHIGMMGGVGMKGTIDISQMVFEGIPLEVAEQKELVDMEDESAYIDYWDRGRYIHRNLEELLGIKEHELLKMYLMGEIHGGVSMRMPLEEG